MSESGTRLRNNNEKIVKLMALLQKERDEMNFLIDKQQDEKVKIQNEIEKLTFKLALLTKSLNQRVQARSNYDKTIKEIQDNYSVLVNDSAKLLDCLTKEVQILEELMDKKTSTDQAKEKMNGADEKKKAEDEKKKETEEKKRKEAEDEHLMEQLELVDKIKELEFDQKESEMEPPALDQESSETSKPEHEVGFAEIKSANNLSPKSSPMMHPADFADDELNLDDDEVEVKWTSKRIRSNEQAINKVGPTYLDKIPTVKEAKRRSSNTLDERRRSGRSSNASKNGMTFKNAADNKEIDIEVQSFREAYGRQHMPPSPPGESSRRSSYSSKHKN